MPDRSNLPTAARRATYLDTVLPREQAPATDPSCRAFGYLRGLQEQAVAVRFCFRSGTTLCLPYAWLRCSLRCSWLRLFMS